MPAKDTPNLTSETLMKLNIVLTIASLLTIVLGTFHLADDIDRGMSPEDSQTSWS